MRLAIPHLAQACRAFLTALVLWGSGAPAAGAQTPGTSKVGSGVMAAVETAGAARVVVALREPEALRKSAQDLAAVQRGVRAVQQRVLAAVPAAQFEPVHVYRAVPALSGIVRSQAALDRLARHPDVRRIDLDAGGSGGLDASVSIIRADDWHDEGVTGSGVVTAVLDSGLDTDHADLASSLVHEACFLDFDGTLNGQGRCPNGSDRQTGPGAAEDDHGHGTNVTGIITSDGAQGAPGVAYDAQVVALKVLDSDNAFNAFSEITAALDYLITNPSLGVQVINMSLGTNALFPSTCDNTTSWNMAGASAINTLRANGVIAFAASMNDGEASKIASPACLSGVVAVGATDDNDNVAPFANTSPILDLVAPGVGIRSSGMGNGTSSFTGTSQAAPHAAGCAALLISAGAATAPDAIETLVTNSPVEVTDPKNGLTFPRLDCFTNAIPVELASFTARIENGAVQLRWRTESETNNAGFFVERAAPGGFFRERGFVAGAGTTARPQTYRFTDASLPIAADTLQYRLKQVDVGGAAAYSPVVAVVRDAPAGTALRVLRNPVRSAIRLMYALPKAAPVRVELYNAVGQRVAVLADGFQPAGRYALTHRTAALASGTYFARLLAEGRPLVRKITVVR